METNQDSKEKLFRLASNDLFDGALICKSRCSECPFRENTAAAKCEPTKQLMRYCVERDVPFMCHKTMKRVKGQILGIEITDSIPTHICAGWVESR